MERVKTFGFDHGIQKREHDPVIKAGWDCDHGSPKEASEHAQPVIMLIGAEQGLRTGRAPKENSAQADTSLELSPTIGMMSRRALCR